MLKTENDNGSLKNKQVYYKHFYQEWKIAF